MCHCVDRRRCKNKADFFYPCGKWRNFSPFQREEMLQKMNVWDNEKSIKDTDVTGKLMDETKEELSDTKTELTPLTRAASNIDN